MSRTERAIGVFDSGLGGLTVVKQLFQYLPYEDIVYFGDTARVPYGTKSKSAIIKFSKENTEVLRKYNIKMVVVACNSSTSYALTALKRECDFPVVGVIKPGVRMAVQMTKNNRVGVIATSATIKSGAYQKTIKNFNSRIAVYDKACPLFVPLVEEGWLTGKVTKSVAEKYLMPLKKSGIDCLILGCTHYPLLKSVLQQVMGEKVVLVDSAQAVALEVKEVLRKNKLFKKKQVKAKHRFIVSDKPQEFAKIAQGFLGKKIEKVELYV